MNTNNIKIYTCDLRFNLESRDNIEIEDLQDLMLKFGFKKVKCVDEDDYSIVMNAIAEEEIVNRFEEEQEEITSGYKDIEYVEVFKRDRDTIPYYPHLKTYFNEGAWKSYMDVLEEESF